MLLTVVSMLCRDEPLPAIGELESDSSHGKENVEPSAQSDSAPSSSRTVEAGEEPSKPSAGPSLPPRPAAKGRGSGLGTSLPPRGMPSLPARPARKSPCPLPSCTISSQARVLFCQALFSFCTEGFLYPTQIKSDFNNTSPVCSLMGQILAFKFGERPLPLPWHMILADGAAFLLPWLERGTLPCPCRSLSGKVPRSVGYGLNSKAVHHLSLPYLPSSVTQPATFFRRL